MKNNMMKHEILIILQNKQMYHNIRNTLESRAECEELLGKMIAEVRQQIQEEKEQMKGMRL